MLSIKNIILLNEFFFSLYFFFESNNYVSIRSQHPATKSSILIERKVEKKIFYDLYLSLYRHQQEEIIFKK